MPRKKKGAAPAEPNISANQNNSTAMAEPPTTTPADIDGPPVDEKGQIIKFAPKENDGQMEIGEEPAHGKNWGPPYKALISTPTFEMGEDRRWKQRVFKFKERPTDDVLAALKEAGFTYRGNEKAWTIQATPDTRRLADELAQEFAGPLEGRSR